MPLPVVRDLETAVHCTPNLSLTHMSLPLTALGPADKSLSSSYQ